jgi:hypothetical protein
VRAAKRRQQAQLAWAAACDDARHLAVELAAGRPVQPIEVMRLGLVIEPDETAYRYVAATISQYDMRAGLWPIPTQVTALITDRRLIARLPHGAVISYWWNSVVALDVNLEIGQVVLDFGDNEPRAIGGPAVAILGVMAIRAIFGLEGLLRHLALVPLRPMQRGASALGAAPDPVSMDIQMQSARWPPLT